MSTISYLQSLPDLEDNALSESLKVINAKLDAILNLLSFRDKGSHHMEPAQVNISGSGVSFESNESYSLGDLVELKLIIPVAPELVFYVYGEVVNTYENGDGVHKVCIKFTVIDEEIRDRIVKFVFEKQREMLRKLRRQ